MCREDSQFEGALCAINTIFVMTAPARIMFSPSSSVTAPTVSTTTTNEIPRMNVVFHYDSEKIAEGAVDILRAALLHRLKYFLSQFPLLFKGKSVTGAARTLRLILRDSSNKLPTLVFDPERTSWVETLTSSSLLRELEETRSVQQKSVPASQLILWLAFDCNAPVHRRAVAAATTSSSLWSPRVMPQEIKVSLRAQLHAQSSASDVRLFWELLRNNPIVASYATGRNLETSELVQQIGEAFGPMHFFGDLFSCGSDPNRSIDAVVHCTERMFRDLHSKLLLAPFSISSAPAARRRQTNVEMLLWQVPVMHEFFALWTGVGDRTAVSLQAWFDFYREFRSKPMLPQMLMRTFTAADAGVILHERMKVFFASDTFADLGKSEVHSDFLQSVVEFVAPFLLNKAAAAAGSGEDNNRFLVDLLARFCVNLQSGIIPSDDESLSRSSSTDSNESNNSSRGIAGRDELACILGPSNVFLIRRGLVRRVTMVDFAMKYRGRIQRHAFYLWWNPSRLSLSAACALRFIEKPAAPSEFELYHAVSGWKWTPMFERNDPYVVADRVRCFLTFLNFYDDPNLFRYLCNLLESAGINALLVKRILRFLCFIAQERSTVNMPPPIQPLMHFFGVIAPVSSKNSSSSSSSNNNNRRRL